MAPTAPNTPSIVQPVAAASDHQHSLRVERVQDNLTLDAGETDSVDVNCPSGMFATDASVLILDIPYRYLPIYQR